MLLNFAAFGLDQDMTQRILTCKNAKEANKAMLLSVLLVIPVMLLFIIIGLLLFILYQRPDIMQMLPTNELIQDFQGEKITIFMYYVLNEIPSGVRGFSYYWYYCCGLVYIKLRVKFNVISRG